MTTNVWLKQVNKTKSDLSFQCGAAELSGHPSLLPTVSSIPFRDAEWPDKSGTMLKNLPEVFTLLFSLQQMHKGAERQAGGPLGNRVPSSPGLRPSYALKTAVFQGSNIP